MKRCNTCGKDLPVDCFSPCKKSPSGLSYICKSCHAIKVKESRLRHPERTAESHLRYRQSELGKKAVAKFQHTYRKRNPEKHKAHRKFYKALRSKRIVRPQLCEQCGVLDECLHGHHEDYSKPYDVQWLCQPCHVAIHKQKNRATELETSP